RAVQAQARQADLTPSSSTAGSVSRAISTGWRDRIKAWTGPSAGPVVDCHGGGVAEHHAVLVALDVDRARERAPAVDDERVGPLVGNRRHVTTPPGPRGAAGRAGTRPRRPWGGRTLRRRRRGPSGRRTAARRRHRAGCRPAGRS